MCYSILSATSLIQISATGEWDDWLYVFKLALGGWLTHFGTALERSVGKRLLISDLMYSAIPDHGASDVLASLCTSPTVFI